jgi:alpha-D-ribose 1-methylphosphonate 5-triphosphate diphosphatase
LALADVGISLPRAVSLASLNPARAVGLADRGELAAGRRADMVRVRVVDGAPIVRAAWREGERVV